MIKHSNQLSLTPNMQEEAAHGFIPRIIDSSIEDVVGLRWKNLTTLHVLNHFLHSHVVSEDGFHPSHVSTNFDINVNIFHITAVHLRFFFV